MEERTWNADVGGSGVPAASTMTFNVGELTTCFLSKPTPRQPTCAARLAKPASCFVLEHGAHCRPADGREPLLYTLQA